MIEQLQQFFKLDSFWNILLYILVVVLVSWLISRVLRFFIRKSIRRRRKGEIGGTSLNFLRHSINFFVGITAILYIIYSVPFFKSKATLIFSGAGILAAILGFAAQAAISNLIAGAFIVLFKPFRVGDYIKLDDKRIGIVQDITLRHTIINNFENKRLIIPNSVISTESVLNHTIEDSHILSFNEFKVGLTANIDEVRKIIQEEALKLDYVIDNRTPEEIINKTREQVEVRVVDVFETYVLLRAYVWISEPFQEFKIKCKLKESVHKRFVKEGIELPIPITRVIKAD